MRPEAHLRRVFGVAKCTEPVRRDELLIVVRVYFGQLGYLVRFVWPYCGVNRAVKRSASHFLLPTGYRKSTRTGVDRFSKAADRAPE